MDLLGRVRIGESKVDHRRGAGVLPVGLEVTRPPGLLYSVLSGWRRVDPTRRGGWCRQECPERIFIVVYYRDGV